MNKKALSKTAIILLSILLVILIAGVSIYFYITGSSTTTAFLFVEQGKVQVDQGSGWMDAQDRVELGLNDKVKTFEGGKATLVLYESAVISLEPLTELEIKDLEKENLLLRQEKGSTWNKFTGLLGVSGLSIETPNTVATVRGTSFGVDMDAVLVAEGKVEVELDGEKLMILSEEKAIIKETTDENGNIKRELVKAELNEEDYARISENLGRSIEQLKKLRLREINKKKFLVDKIKDSYDLSDADIKEKMDEADRGMYDLNELEEKSPIKTETVAKVKMITAKIIEENKLREQFIKR